MNVSILKPSANAATGVKRDATRLWDDITERARAAIREDASMESYLSCTIVEHSALQVALSKRLAAKLAEPAQSLVSLHEMFVELLTVEQVLSAVVQDLQAIVQRDFRGWVSPSSDTMQSLFRRFQRKSSAKPPLPSRMRRLGSFRVRLAPLARCAETTVLDRRQLFLLYLSMGLVATACDDDDGGRRLALQELCRKKYWYPLYSYLRQRGYGADEASNLIQEFIVLLLDPDFVRRAETSGRRLRTFLYAAISEFIVGKEESTVPPRDTQQPAISPAENEAARRFRFELTRSHSIAERAYLNAWARNINERVLGDIELEYRAAGRSSLFLHLRDLLWRPNAPDVEETSAKALGMTIGALKVSIHRLRHRARFPMREVVAETVTDPREIDDELSIVVAAL